MKALASKPGESGFGSFCLRNKPLLGLQRLPALSGDGKSALLARQRQRVAVVELVVEHRIAHHRGAVLRKPRPQRAEEDVGGSHVLEVLLLLLLLVALLLAVGAGAGEVSVGELEGVAAEGEGRALGTLALAGAGGGGGALVGVPEVGAGDLERVAELEDFVLEVGEVGVGVFSADDRGAETLRAGSCGRGGGLGEPLLGLARAGGEGGGGSSAGGGGGDHVGGRHVCLSWWWWFLLLLVLMLMWWWW